MADVTITIPNGVLARVLDAIAAEYNYDATQDGTKAQFAKAQIIAFVKRTIKAAEGSAEADFARRTKEQEIDSNISIS